MDMDGMHAGRRDMSAPRQMGFQSRANCLARLAKALADKRAVLLEASLSDGANAFDFGMDFDVGLDVLKHIAASCREWPDQIWLPDGDVEALDGTGTTVRARMLTSRSGVAWIRPGRHTPCARMLRDIALAFMTGQACIVRTSDATARTSGLLARAILDAGCLPEDAFRVTDRDGPEGIADRAHGNLAVLDESTAADTAAVAVFVAQVALSLKAEGGHHVDAVHHLFVPAPHLDPIATALAQPCQSVDDPPSIHPYRDIDDVVSWLSSQDRPGEGVPPGTSTPPPIAFWRLACHDASRSSAWIAALGGVDAGCAMQVVLMDTSRLADAAADEHDAIQQTAARWKAIAMETLARRLTRHTLVGSPRHIAQVIGEHVPGAPVREDGRHPFRKHYDELRVGDSLLTHRRTVTEADISAFGGISGDYFYMHFDEIAARASPFGRRIAHGYFVLSAAAGLFVHPAEGPVLANYGLEKLRFIKPVGIGDTIQARLTCKRKADKPASAHARPQGVVCWDVLVTNQNGEPVARYDILTLVAKSETTSPLKPTVGGLGLT